MVNEELTITSKKEAFIASLREHQSALAEIAPSMVENAKKALEEIDFPTTRVEEWKYTRTTRISGEKWAITPNKEAIDTKPYLIPGLDTHVLVFVNGKYNKSLTSLKDTHLTLEEHWQEENKDTSYRNIFQALNVAYSTGALKIHLKKNLVEETPIHILHIITDEKALAQPSIFIHVEKSAELHVVESFAIQEGLEVKSFTNRILDIIVEENATLTVDKIQIENDQNFLYNEENVHIANNGNFTINTVTIDGGWVRNDLNISLDGENIDAYLNGIYLPRRKQHVDNHTTVNHCKPNSHSNELYKGIMDDQGAGVFNGRVHVLKDAQKTNAYQSNANILLSNDAQVSSKPELEIYADDVKCSHGTTTGQMDESALFYLKTRGIGDENARKLLAAAFINDVVNRIQNKIIREYTVEQLVKRELLFV